MELRERLRIVADAAKYDASCASSGSTRARPKGGLGDTNGMGICHSYTPDGRCVSLLKILLTNHCLYDCLFCINRVSSSVPRARLTPEEVAFITIEFYKRNYIEGLFLSSGIVKSEDHTMAELVRAAQLLRTVHRFGGYIHLKAIAGCAPDLLEEAGRFADRVSANIELASQRDLDALAPAKSTATINATMAEVKRKLTERHQGQRRDEQLHGRQQHGRSERTFLPAGQTTQMIVGATPSSDRQLLDTAQALYRTHQLRRVYYSAYSPTQEVHALLPNRSSPLLREHRLYQADWLFRFYGFTVGELTTIAEPNLSLAMDPKLAWALRNRHLFPVDVNRAPKELLLRVPGFGRNSVQRILQSRRFRALQYADLARLRVPLDRARYFIEFEQRNPYLARLDSELLPQLFHRPAQQLSLFSQEQSADAKSPSPPQPLPLQQDEERRFLLETFRTAVAGEL